MTDYELLAAVRVLRSTGRSPKEIARTLGVSLTVAATTLNDTWWRVPVLVLSAAANAWAEEVVLIGNLLPRFRQLGWAENRSVLVSALLRGRYPQYPGPGGLVGKARRGCGGGRGWAGAGGGGPGHGVGPSQTGGV